MYTKMNITKKIADELTQSNLSMQPNIYISKTDIEAAYQRIKRFLKATPVIRSAYYSDLLGAEVFLKLEILQPTHSFKVRGALNAVLAMPEELRSKGIVTASGGNHGLGIALVCKLNGTRAVVYLPVHTPQIKVDALKKLGAEVIMYGEVWDEANNYAKDVAKKQGMSYVHPFNDPLVIAGQSTLILELIEQIGNPDLIVASIGGGGLVSGIISTVHHFSIGAKVAGVETIGADSMNQSIKVGTIIELPAITSIAESLGAKRTEELTFKIVQKGISQLVTVEDKSAVKSIFELLEQEKVLAEPAASCCLAALTEGKIHFSPGSKIVVVVCGANVSLDKLALWRQKYLGN